MSTEDNNPKIKIMENGPYVVTGNVPISEKIIKSGFRQNEYVDGQEYSHSEEYELCRCGKSKNAPFCDGSHETFDFDGTETAPRNSFHERAKEQTGPGMNLLDDVDLCAYARFCHRRKGDVWNLTDMSDRPELKEEAIKAAVECPAGRLVPLEKDGKLIEPEYEPSVEILQDPKMEVSGPIYVKGGIPIESSDGYVYEKRNRVTLCRCGKSGNMPFCDASHIDSRYRDNEHD